ncbi:MAG: PEP-CTERM sorting domain-containing protein [Candidatus Eisenbacteria bacterium]|nr:PEP-CTERM sorting domain-containing protein [Candidatus Eisenbacteria bacterium]
MIEPTPAPDMVVRPVPEPGTMALASMGLIASAPRPASVARSSPTPTARLSPRARRLGRHLPS